MAFVFGLGIIIVALLGYVRAGTASEIAYRQQRDLRYSADAALEEGIAWAAANANVGIDSTTAPACHLQVPGSGTTPDMDVTCATTPGSGSGLPNDQGQTPEYAMLMTGQRDKEAPSYEGSWCPNHGATQSWDTLTTSGSGRIERGIRFSKTRTACVATRSANTWDVNGKVFSNSPIIVDSGGSMRAVGTGSEIRARGGCQNVDGCQEAGRTNADPMDPTSTIEGHDPRTDQCSASAAQQAKCDGWKLTTDAQGRLLATDSTGATFVLPNRDAEIPSPSQCLRGKVLRFKPGWYSDVGKLNALFKSANCDGTIFWFMPEAGAGGVPLGDSYRQGIYYFGFTNGTGGGCNYYNESASTAHQWCIGNNNNADQIVVGGTPFGWNPDADTSGPGTSTAQLTTANVSGITGTSPFWQNAGNARTIDQAPDGPRSATYGNDILAIDRPITLEGWGPKVSSGNYTGSFNIQVAHETPSRFNAPKVTVTYDTALFGSKTCGTYTLHKGTFTRDGLDQLSAGDQVALGACLNTGDKINGVKVKWTVSGCTFLCNQTARLDGMILAPGGYPAQPQFPQVPSSTDSGGDCDDTKPGVQFIFGGDSHVYVADGSMELCAGPSAHDPVTGQQIAVYGVPALQPVRSIPGTATPVSVTSGNAQSTTTLVNGGNAERIAEPAGPDRGAAAGISYGNGNCGRGFLGSYNVCIRKFQGGLRTSYRQMALPEGLEVSRVLVRATYNTKGGITAPELQLPGCSSRLEFSASGLFSDTFLGGPAQEVRAAPSCFTDQIIAASGATPGTFNATWWAGATKFCYIFGCTGGWTDDLDGVEFIVETRAKSGAGPVAVPQQGCITDTPNYWNVAKGGDGGCAVVKADQTVYPLTGGNSRGRVSFKGTVYAPSAAIDIDDEDVLYPFFNRGLVARTLMLRGFRYRNGVRVPIVDVPTLDRSQKPREVVFTVCVRAPGHEDDATPCDPARGAASGGPDRVYARARVRFEIDKTPGVPNTAWATVPKVQWWTVDP